MSQAAARFAKNEGCVGSRVMAFEQNKENKKIKKNIRESKLDMHFTTP